MTFPTEWKVIKFMFQTTNQPHNEAYDHCMVSVFRICLLMLDHPWLPIAGDFGDAGAGLNGLVPPGGNGCCKNHRENMGLTRKNVV